MNKIYLFIFVLLLGCSQQSSKIYICGDHPCKNKKEIEDYFKNNISIEVYILESKKKKRQNQDLVELNLSKEESFTEKKKDRLTFLEKRKTKLANKRKKEKPSKLKLKVERVDEEITKDLIKKKKSDISSKTFSYKKSKSTKIVHLCKKIEECDINVISKKINDIGKEKSFPDITHSKQ